VASNFGLPADPAQDRPDRHRSMRGLLDTTWQLLPEAERRALERLALFRGGFDRAAATAVAGATLPQLAGLADRALLARTASGRYDMHPLVQQYAAERLGESGDAPAVRQRFVAHLAGLVEQAEPHLKGADEQAWFDRLAAEHDNLRAVLELALQGGAQASAARMCAVLRWFWYIRGYIAEGRQWLERVLRAADAGGEPIAPAIRARLLQGAGVLASDQADYPRATAYFQACVALNRELGDAVGVQAAVHSLGLLAVEQGDYAGAQACFEESLAVCRELGHSWGVANRLNSLGTLAQSQRQHDRALGYLEEALAVARPLGNDQLTAMILGNLADVALSQGDLARAQATYRSALAQYRALGDPRSAGLAHQGLGALALVQGDIAEAARQLHEGLAISWASANRRDLATYMGHVAALWLAQGRPADAARLCASIEAFRARANISMAALDRRQHEGTLAGARAALDPAAFEVAWAEGGLTPLDQLIEAALAQ
jgi:tetratricopeptide (TPR) repeat protein